MGSTSPLREQFAKYQRQQNKFQRWTWVSILLPLALFVVLLVMAGRELTKLGELKRKNADQIEQINKNAATIAQQEQELQAKSIALSAFKSQRSSPVPTIAYYRASLGPQLDEAMKQLGYRYEAPELVNHPNPTLSDKPVDTLVYSCAVTEHDIRLIVAALNQKGIPIRRIEPAKNPNPLLIQLIASAKTDSNMPPVDPERWKKTTPSC